MSNVIRKLAHASASDPLVLSSDELIEIGKRVCSSLKRLTGHELEIFYYFVCPRLLTISCTFFSKGIFPADVYEGVCSTTIREDGRPSATCDLFPFHENKRLVRFGPSDYPDEYLYVTFQFGGNLDVEAHKWVWLSDEFGEWRDLIHPRTEMYVNPRLHVEP